MVKCIIYCEKCDKQHETDIESTSDLPDVKCPKCKSDRIFFVELGFKKDNRKLEMGKGGCGTVFR